MHQSETLALYMDFISTEKNHRKITMLSNCADEDLICDLLYDGYHDQIIFFEGNEKVMWTSATFDDVLLDLDKIQTIIDKKYKKLIKGDQI